MTEKEKRHVFRQWRGLVNMKPHEIEDFLIRHGSDAGLSRGEAAGQGIRSGRDSARALIRMIPKLDGKRTFAQASEVWSSSDWAWAKAQVSFIRRFRGMALDVAARRNDPYRYTCGRPKRLLLALNLWGHKPGGKIA